MTRAFNGRARESDGDVTGREVRIGSVDGGALVSLALLSIIGLPI